MMRKCCAGFTGSESSEEEFEIVKIAKTKAVCAQCEKATEQKAERGVSIAVISCEGACLRGELSRRVANKICFEKIPEKTFRVCLGGAFTKNTNQRKLVSNSQRVITLEGCGIMCASRMMNGVLPDVTLEPVLVNRYYKMDNSLFAMNDLSSLETEKLADTATTGVLELLSGSPKSSKQDEIFNCGC